MLPYFSHWLFALFVYVFVANVCPHRLSPRRCTVLYIALLPQRRRRLQGRQPVHRRVERKGAAMAEGRGVMAAALVRRGENGRRENTAVMWLVIWDVCMLSSCISS